MSTRRVVRVGLLGLGTVGAGVAEILVRHRKLIAERSGVELMVVRAFVRNLKKRRHGAAARIPLTRRPEEIVAADDIDVVVELLGGMQPAYALAMEALRHGRPVVTANKAVLALHGEALSALARRHGTDLYFEAAVAGGLPIIRTLREGLAADRITRLLGILNGTTNFILGRVEAGASYADALREAQSLGFAEADPTLDVSGRDAADKLAILVRLAFGAQARPEVLTQAGITELTPEILRDAAELGFRVKLLAMAERLPRGIDASVQPVFVPHGHPLSTVSGADNAVAVESDALGTTLYQGRGAGGLPTGSAVVSDLIDAGRNIRAGIGGRDGGVVRSAPPLLAGGYRPASYYVRLLVSERPGVLASVTNVFAGEKVSLATVLQRERGGRGPVPIVMVTHPATPKAMRAVAAKLKRLRALQQKPQMIRIL